MEERYFIGIDPGTNGGIAVLDRTGGIAGLTKMPQTPMDIIGYLREWAGGKTAICVLEDVGHGIPNQSSKATATFARHNGHLEMALIALRIPTEKVTPQKWVKTYQLGKSSEYDKRDWKNRLKAKAQQIFPSAGELITLATCDALLLAEYGRRNFKVV